MVCVEHAAESIPCPHLTWVAAAIDVTGEMPAGSSQRASVKSVSLIWELGGVGHRDDSSSAHDYDLVEYITAYGMGQVPRRARPKGDHWIVGGSAGQREQAAEGSGEFLLRAGGAHFLYGMLDGWAVFAVDRGQVLGQLHNLTENCRW